MSECAVTELSVRVSGQIFQAESLGAGESKVWQFMAGRDDHYVIRFRADSAQVADSFGYVTSGMTFNDVIRIRPDTLLFEAVSP